MMELKIRWILLLMTVFIDLSISAVFFPFDDRKYEVDYKKSRNESVHRGVVLSYSVAKKNRICWDLFSVYRRKSTVISDGLKKKGELEHSVVVKEPTFDILEKDHPDRLDLHFLCSGKDLINMKFEEQEYEYFVSSAHKPGIMYYSEGAPWGHPEVLVKSYLGISPEYVSLDQMQLEKQYAKTRETIRALRAESPAYVRLIERRDNITELSKWQQFLLCSSVLLSPEHEVDRRDFTLHWSNFKKKAKKYSRMYKKVCLKFEDTKYQSGDWCTDGLYCRDTAILDHLLLTRSYDDQDSVYVVIERDDKPYLRQYIKNVPILMNVHVPFTLHSKNT